MARTAATYVNSQLFHIAAKFVTTDKTAYASTSSPISCASTANNTLLCPDWAAAIQVLSNKDIKLSELSTFKSYSLLCASTEYEFGMGEMDQVYFKNVGSGTAKIYFRFLLV